MRRALGRAFSLSWLLLVGCGEKSPSGGSGNPSPAVDVSSAQGELPHADVAPIRDAARRLDPADIPLLQRHLLARGEARLWAAFALGKLCTQDRLAISSALTSAFGIWASAPEPPGKLELSTMARALGACASPDTEKTLRSWLAPEASAPFPGLAEAAALGLGAWAERSGKLEERTLTVLLDAAERDKKAELLYPLGRLRELEPALAARTLDVAGALVTSHEAVGSRHFAVLALGSAGPSAALPLSILVLHRDFAGIERAAAVGALSRLGPSGQRAIDETLAELLSRGLPSSAQDENWLVLNALSRALEQPVASKRPLAELPQAPLPDAEARPARAQRRRLIALRCRAAELLAGKNEHLPALTSCDPDHGTEERIARLTVLARGDLAARRGVAFDQLAREADPRALQAALRLLPAHAEFSGSLELLVHALSRPEAGSLATALSIVAAHPGRAQSSAKEPVPDPRILAVVERLLGSASSQTPLETSAAALSAAGALGVLTLKPLVEQHCLGSAAALWPRASAALALLGNPGRQCKGSEPPKAPPPGAVAVSPPTVVHFDSDVGELSLHLDAADATRARARIVELMKSGHYAGALVSAAVPGFAVSFGDPDGDGYENENLGSLPDELGPSPFGPLSVGLSSFAPGAASSLLMVTLSDAPQFTGEKTRLGSASGPWQLLAPGDGLGDPRVE